MTGTKDLIKSSRALMTPFEEMERWFEDMWARPSSLLASSLWPGGRLAELKELSPSVDMYVDGHELVFKADLPGVRKEDLEIDITEDILTISGQKKREENIEGDSYYRFERSYGRFSRRFELPAGTDKDKVKAHFEDGVLEIRIPKAEGAVSKTKKIPIN